MYERFTDRVRKVMQLANGVAREYRAEWIGSEHLLLAILMEGTGVAAHVLKAAGIDLAKVREEVERRSTPNVPFTSAGKLKQAPSAKQAIEYALASVNELKHQYVGTEHLLLGIVDESQSLGAQILADFGVTSETARRDIKKLLGHPGDASSVHQSATWWEKFKKWWRT